MARLDDGRRMVVACACLVATALALAVSAGATPDAAKNLIVNGNAEQGEAGKGYDVVAEIPGWTRKGSFTVVTYGAPNGFPDPSVGSAIGGGASFFAGGPANAGSAISQDLGVSSKRGLIDSGKAKATLSGYIGGFATQNDSLVATALFLSESGGRLGAARIGPVGAAARQTVTGMLKRTVTKPVPRKTRTIRVVLAAGRTAGSYNDGYADNLSLTISR